MPSYAHNTTLDSQSGGISGSYLTETAVARSATTLTTPTATATLSSTPIVAANNPCVASRAAHPFSPSRVVLPGVRHGGRSIKTPTVYPHPSRPTPQPTSTATPSPIATPTETPAPTPTAMPTPTVPLSPTPGETPTVTPLPDVTPTGTSTPLPGLTPRVQGMARGSAPSGSQDNQLEDQDILVANCAGDSINTPNNAATFATLTGYFWFIVGSSTLGTLLFTGTIYHINRKRNK